MGCLVVLFMAMYGEHLSHYDNFSHWGRITKQMLMTDRYPTFRDPIITFTAYPPGSATGIYYFCQLFGGAESTQMVAQSFLMMLCVLPLFSFIKKNKTLSIVYILVLSNIMLVCFSLATELLVDSLLGMFAGATLLFALFCGWLEPLSLPFYLAVATVAARVLSATYNYLINYKVVFKSNQDHARASRRYLLLAVTQMLLSALLVTGGAALLPMLPGLLVKIIVDTILFFLSYYVQKRYVF